MLQINNLVVKYGGIIAVDGVSLQVEQGELVALIGANGAGKTTTLHTVSGLLKAARGEILFRGENITKLPAETIVARGLVQVPEGRQVFARLTVEENLKMGAYLQRDRAAIRRNYERAMEMFPILKQRRRQAAGTLSGGEQQMLAVGRALMGKPKMILMDEPSMGLSPIFVNEIFDIIREVSESGTTVLLVEQNAKKALSIADRAYVLETGKIVLEGDAKDLLNDESIKKAYLGE